MKFQKPRALRPGDRVAVVSLSSGRLGDPCCAHDIPLGTKRLRTFGLEPVFMPNALKGSIDLAAHPEARADDLKAAFFDDSIAGIICAIGGDDTYRLAPFLMADAAFCRQVHDAPKLFTGFSDTTVDHLMLYRLGLETFYGPCFLCDLAELGTEMLPYTEAAFESYLRPGRPSPIVSSPVWYEERRDFSKSALGVPRISHAEAHGFELLQGEEKPFSGRLLGGCLESFYELLTATRYPDEPEVAAHYALFPSAEEWKGKILFAETCEEKPVPALLEQELAALRERGVFDAVNGVIVSKPQDEAFYEEYKTVWRRATGRPDLPVLYNVNFGHAYPRTALAYGAHVEVDPAKKEIRYLENVLL